MWVNKFGGKKIESARALSVDASGIYIGGTFQDTVVVGTTTLIANAFDNSFVCKLDPTGNFVWAKQSNVSEIISVYKNPTGNIYTTGYFSGTAVFGTFTLTSTGLSDIFIATLDANGTVLSFNKMGGTLNDIGYSIKTDSNGNILIGGYFSGTAFFGSFALTAFGNNDAFVAKLNSGGSVLWVKQFGGTGFDGIASISINSSNNVYVGGTYNSPASIGAITFTTGNSFVCQLDNSGSVLWANEFGGASSSNYADVYGIASDAAGNVYSTGNYKGMVAFGSSTLSAAFLNSFSKDVFISKLNPTGNFIWVKGFGSNFDDLGNSICEDNGKLYTTGNSGTATIDNFTFTPSAGAFLIKLSSNLMSIKKNYQNINVSVYPNPVSDKLVIESEELNQNLQISVTDFLGKEVLNKNFIYSKTETLDVSTLLPGIYFLRVNSNEKSGVVKIVKE